MQECDDFVVAHPRAADLYTDLPDVDPPLVQLSAIFGRNVLIENVQAAAEAA